MTHVCAHCGATITGGKVCRFCDSARSKGTRRSSTPEVIAHKTEGNLAVAPDWRGDLSQRLAAHRARKQKLCPELAQTDLPFEEASESEPPEITSTPFHDPIEMTPVAPPEPPRRRVERMAIDLSQPPLDFEHDGGVRPSQKPALMVSPAPLEQRRFAGLLDAALLLLAYGGFLTIFSLLGGHWSLSKFALGVTAGTIAIFYAQYFALSMLFRGATLGMRLRGLRVVTFEGGQPSHSQLLRRGLGYLVSGGMLLLGFAWARWDSDHLCWHDHISQTCITSDESK